jgi:hypothetical protein
MEPNYSIVEVSDKHVLIKDEGPWDEYTTVTNAAELVVERISKFLGKRRLEYIDSEGNRDEILVENGEFAGFRSLRDNYGRI